MRDEDIPVPLRLMTQARDQWKERAERGARHATWLDRENLSMHRSYIRERMHNEELEKELAALRRPRMPEPWWRRLLGKRPEAP